MAAQLGSGDPLQIGSILQDTRRRQGIEIETVEERTKIRRKYLRAIENEDWDALPDPAYTRGFLRTYADLLGLDSEVLVDEYRRRYEEPSTSTYELVEPLLHGRVDNGAKTPIPRLAAVGAIATAVVLVLLVLGLTSGDEERGGGGERATREQPAGDPRVAGGGEASGSGPQTVTVKLVARSDLQACLVDRRGHVLVPDQVLTAGTEDGPYTSRRFRIELNPAAARLVVDGERAPVPRTEEAAAYRVTPSGVRPTTYTGALCP